MTTVVDALLEQNLSPQWHGFLCALAAEFEAQLNHEELRQLMFRIGGRFAAAHALPPCESTDDLRHSLNARWAAMQWGCVDLTDEGEYLRIVHHAAPLLTFGRNALGWAPAFLQGCYQGWLDEMGASPLTVVQAGDPEAISVVEFHLARANV